MLDLVGWFLREELCYTALVIVSISVNALCYTSRDKFKLIYYAYSFL